MAREPHREIQEKWVKCGKIWVKINKAMKDIGFPEFGKTDDVVDLHNIVKLHTEQDSSWAEELAKVMDTTPCQVRQFIEHPIKSRVVLQQLSFGIVKYRAHAVEKGRFTWPRWNNIDSHTPIPVRICSSNGRSTRRVTLLSDILR